MSDSDRVAAAEENAGALYLLFTLQQDRYALNVHEVVEVLPLRRLKHLPQSPDWVVGVFDYRGQAVPVLDLLLRTAGRPAATLASTRLVLVHYPPAARVLGLILEQATDTLRLPEQAFRSSGVAAGEAPYLGAVQACDGRLVQRIELAGLLPAEVCQLLFPDAAERS